MVARSAISRPIFPWSLRPALVTMGFLLMYAAPKSWVVKRTRVNVTYHRSFMQVKGRFVREVLLERDLTGEQRAAFSTTANRCPVQLPWSAALGIETRLVEPEALDDTMVTYCRYALDVSATPLNLGVFPGKVA